MNTNRDSLDGNAEYLRDRLPPAVRHDAPCADGGSADPKTFRDGLHRATAGEQFGQLRRAARRCVVHHVHPLSAAMRFVQAKLSGTHARCGAT